MIQYHRIRLNEAFSSATVPFFTELRNSNGYYSYGNSVGGGVVTRFNVRSFLNDIKNQVIINDFIAYLSGNTTDDELVKILGDDEQLTNIFNQFYEVSVMNGAQTSPDVVSKTMMNVSAITYYDTDHYWNGTSLPTGLDNIPMSIDGSNRHSNIKTVKSRISSDDSYYIPVFIKESYAEIGKQSHDHCPLIISLLLRPDLNTPNSITETTENKSYISDESMRVVNDNVSRQFNQESLSVRFITLGNGLVARCYSSQCVNNRYCDILYFTNRKIAEINAIDTEHIRNLLGEEHSNLTDRAVMDVLIREMVNQGEPVAFPIFSCLF